MFIQPGQSSMTRQMFHWHFTWIAVDLIRITANHATSTAVHQLPGVDSVSSRHLPTGYAKNVNHYLSQTEHVSTYFICKPLTSLCFNIFVKKCRGLQHFEHWQWVYKKRYQLYDQFCSNYRVYLHYLYYHIMNHCICLMMYYCCFLKNWQYLCCEGLSGFYRGDNPSPSPPAPTPVRSRCSFKIKRYWLNTKKKSQQNR